MAASQNWSALQNPEYLDRKVLLFQVTSCILLWTNLVYVLFLWCVIFRSFQAEKYCSELELTDHHDGGFHHGEPRIAELKLLNT